MRSSVSVFTVWMFAGLALAALPTLTSCSNDADSGGNTCSFGQLQPPSASIEGTWCVTSIFEPGAATDCAQGFDPLPSRVWSVGLAAAGNGVTAIYDGLPPAQVDDDVLTGTASGLDVKLSGTVSEGDVDTTLSCAAYSVSLGFDTSQQPDPTKDSFVGEANFSASIDRDSTCSGTLVISGFRVTTDCDDILGP